VAQHRIAPVYGRGERLVRSECAESADFIHLAVSADVPTLHAALDFVH
jgi:hypothetical protein